MAENAVVKQQLTDEMVEAGAQLMQKLDEMGVPVAAALWFYDPEINEWRLLFASSEVSARGSRPIYEKIQEAIDALGDRASGIPLFAIGVLDAQHPLLALLRSAVQTEGGVSRIRFSKNVINGQFIEDALIYRVT